LLHCKAKQQICKLLLFLIPRHCIPLLAIPAFCTLCHHVPTDMLHITLLHQAITVHTNLVYPFFCRLADLYDALASSSLGFSLPWPTRFPSLPTVSCPHRLEHSLGLTLTSPSLSHTRKCANIPPTFICLHCLPPSLSYQASPLLFVPFALPFIDEVLSLITLLWTS
jgi:hypothetical protein